jgi:hypothetical protein
MKCTAVWQGGFVRKVPVNKTRWNRDNIKKNQENISSTWKRNGLRAASDDRLIIIKIQNKFYCCWLLS